MKANLKIELKSFKTIEVLPNSWTNDDYRTIMSLLDFGDTASVQPSELKEMCFMCLADEAPEKSASVLLDYIFNDRLNSGQKDNLSFEMQSENMWEEYAELSMHEEFFNIGQLLYQAYNGKFPHPEAAQFSINIAASNGDSLDAFDERIEENLLRILVQGMPENTLLKRLFTSELENGDFDEAKNIIWQYTKEEGSGNSLDFEIISSLYFFHDLKFANDFEGTLEIEKD